MVVEILAKDNRIVKWATIAAMPPSPGAELALLLLGGFHAMTDEVIAELEARGHPGVRPVHEFALRSIDAGAATASGLGRRLAVSKQAAAKTIAALERLGYVELGPDPDDARRKRIMVTDRGHEMMAIGASLFDAVRERWATQMGPRRLAQLETGLAQVVTPRALGADDLQRSPG